MPFASYLQSLFISFFSSTFGREGGGEVESKKAFEHVISSFFANNFFPCEFLSIFFYRKKSTNFVLDGSWIMCNAFAEQREYAKNAKSYVIFTSQSFFFSLAVKMSLEKKREENAGYYWSIFLIR